MFQVKKHWGEVVLARLSRKPKAPFSTHQQDRRKCTNTRAAFPPWFGTLLLADPPP